MAEGTSTKRAEMTPVMLKSALPHEMQNWPQNSLPLTPRLPIEGKPNECKQEVVDSVVMAGCTNGMVRLAEPTKIADVNEKAALGGEPVERARVIDKGDETEREAQLQLQELKCREINQCSGIANGDVPITNGLPLEGEWTAYLSGETSDSKGDTNASNAAVEHAHGPNELRETDAKEIGSEGCKRGMVERASVDEVGETLITMSIQSEGPGSGDIPHVYLGGTQMWPGDTNRLGS